MRESIKTAKNVDEAIELACKELGVERDVTEFEIISLPKRGFLGLKNTPAKVRVYIEEQQTESRAPAKILQTAATARPAAPARPAAAAGSAPRSAAQRTEPARKFEEKRDPRPAAPSSPRTAAFPARPSREVSRDGTTGPLPPLEFMRLEAAEGKARVAAEYLKEVLGDMGVSADITVAYSQSGAVLRLSGEGLGVIIGRRGETLDSLQYLVGLVGNRGDGDYMRITIDSGNYREKRERTLEALAQKLSTAAVKYGRSSTLEPMNPYERRIIHATVSNIEGVTSSSIGEDPNRRVVITPTGVRPPQQFSGGGRPSSRGFRPMGGRPPQRDGERPGNFSPRPVARPPMNTETMQAGARPPMNTDTMQAGARPPMNPDTMQAGTRPPVNADLPYQAARPPMNPALPQAGVRPPINPAAPRSEFRSRPDGRGDFRAGGRPPRRDFREGGNQPSQPVTPTSLDREYAKEIEQGRPISSPEPAAQPTVKQNAAPAQPLREGKDLPLYGKIDI